MLKFEIMDIKFLVEERSEDDLVCCPIGALWVITSASMAKALLEKRWRLLVTSAVSSRS